jgi:hypothetical protein
MMKKNTFLNLKIEAANGKLPGVKQTQLSVKFA